jgi:hypothetical protein
VEAKDLLKLNLFGFSPGARAASVPA